MGLSKPQRGLLDKLLIVAADLAANRPLATSSELWLKVELAEWLLKNGYAVLEPRNGSTVNATEVRLQSGVIDLGTSPRPKCQGSVDLRVARPELHFELKVRARFGSSEQPRYASYKKDLDNLNSTKAHVFLCVCDLPVYERFTGQAFTKKPRQSFPTVFPPRAQLQTGTKFIQHSGTWDGKGLTVLTRQVACPSAGVDRVVIGAFPS